ncbi:MAG TPA: Hsp20/alpha crystallin family protein [Acholeplasma sp.]|nr:Hsp20/alpha crystallin family protein [Acholeplasma sp.]
MLSLFKKDRDIFDDFFEDFNSWPFQQNTNLMKTDIREHENKYMLDVELPGFAKEDIKVSLLDGYLEIEAEKREDNKQKEKGNFLRRERFYGHVKRSFYVGNIELEQINGSFENGVLHLEIPKENQVSTQKKYLELK